MELTCDFKKESNCVQTNPASASKEVEEESAAKLENALQETAYRGSIQSWLDSLKKNPSVPTYNGCLRFVEDAEKAGLNVDDSKLEAENFR